MHTQPSRWRARFLCGIGLAAIVVFTLAGLATLKVLIDGAQSHAVAVQLRVARYRWLIGNTGAAMRELAEAGALVGPAGLRRQAADLLSLASAGAGWLGQREVARVACRSALATLGFGRYDRAGSGTSHAAARCAETAPVEPGVTTRLREHGRRHHGVLRRDDRVDPATDAWMPTFGILARGAGRCALCSLAASVGVTRRSPRQQRGVPLSVNPAATGGRSR